MASITKRNGKYCVIYAVEGSDGKRKQKWETFDRLDDAKARKSEVEYTQRIGEFVIPSCETVSELLNEYVNLYGKTRWSLSVYESNTGLIRHYILPFLGKAKLREITSRTLEKYYQTLLETPAVAQMSQKKYSQEVRYVTPATVRKVHNLLRSAFSQAEKWDLIEKNPARHATLPKHEPKKREIWDAPTLFRAIECCRDERLKLCLNLAFACSLRIGELLGLTWDCVDISEASIESGEASISITKELQRVNKKALDALDSKDVITVFPEQGFRNKTVLVLKKPKTLSSIRKVFLPKTVAQMLVSWKHDQDETRAQLGGEYTDYKLVIATPVGFPTEASQIRKALDDLIKENNLPPVVFHSLRHSSVTYKLKLTGGDIKAVQGDSGHAQAQMVTDQYSHILDDSRRANAKLMERAFYAGKGAEPLEGGKTQHEANLEKVAAAGIDPTQLALVLGNPELMKMLQMLAQAQTRANGT